MRLGIHKSKSRERTARKFSLVFVVVVLLIVVHHGFNINESIDGVPALMRALSYGYAE